MSNPKLVVTLMPPAGPARTFLRLSAIAFGFGRNGRFLPQTTCDHLEIPLPEGSPVQGDGDVIEHLPARISVDTTPIRLVSPG
jgi:diacylglycerol kinase family enzyme